MLTAYFTNIRKQLLSSLNIAEQEVYIAVAWFTNKDLYQSLLQCLSRGLKVHLVINNDSINNGDNGLDFQAFIDKGGCLYYANSYEPIHHKFCIIDKKLLYTGSYNWTYYAENRNYENILKIEKDISIITAFSQEFEKLLSKLKIIKEVVRIPSNISDNLVREYQGADYYYRAQETSESDYYLRAKELLGNNLIINDTIILEVESLYAKSSKINSSIGIKASLKLGCIFHDHFVQILPKSSRVNEIFKSDFHLEADENYSLKIEFYKGENPKASENIKISEFSILKFPFKIPTDTKITISMIVNSEGEINATIFINQFDLEYKTTFFDKSIIETIYLSA